MRVLYIIDSLTHGGTERQLVELVNKLDRSRVQPHLCTLKESNELFSELDVPKICLGYRSFTAPSILKNLYDLHRFIKKHDIQLVQTFFQDPFLLAALVRPLRSLPLIGSFRDLGFWRTSAESYKMRLAYPFFSGFIANSRAVKDHFVAVDGIASDKIEVLYNGFDLSALEVASADSEGDDPGACTVGIVANLNRPVKRVDDFVSAAALVYRRNPAVRFTVIGGGGLQDDLERLCTELGIRHAVHFTGRIDNPLPFVKNFSVGVITSETEGFCNAIIEYMACGVPVVATRVGGNPELVTEAENGFLVPIGDPEALAEKISLLIENEELRSSIGEANRRKVSEQYSLQVMLEQQTRYYERHAKS